VANELLTLTVIAGTSGSAADAFRPLMRPELLSAAAPRYRDVPALRNHIANKFDGPYSCWYLPVSSTDEQCLVSGAVGLSRSLGSSALSAKMHSPGAWSTAIAISLSGMRNHIRFWSIHSNAIGHSSERSVSMAMAPINFFIPKECAFIATD
jgi:hypothetical protein